MALPFCKLEDLTGSFDDPNRVILSIVDENDQRFTIRRLQMQPNDEIHQNLFEFDDQDLIPFQNPLQLKLGLNGEDGRDFGSVIIDPADVGRDELTQTFGGVGVGESSYVLTYGVR